MSRLLGYMCNDDSLTPCAMQEIGHQILSDTTRELAALGFGWVQEARTLLRKHPSADSKPVDVLGLLSDIPARAIVGHMQQKINGRVDTLDLQPFRFRKWVFSQTGSVANFAEFRDELIADIPDHIRRNIQGKTQAEVVFHRFYHWMKKLGALAAPHENGRQVAQALAKTLEEVEQRARQAGLEGPVEIDVVAATEKLMLCARTGDPLYYRLFEGVEEPADEPLFAGHRPKRHEHPHFRGVFLTSAGDAAPADEDWQELSQRHVAWVDRSWEATVVPLDELTQQADEA